MNPVRGKMFSMLHQRLTGQQQGAPAQDQTQPVQTPQQATPTAPRRRRSFATGIAGRALLGGA